MYGIVGLSTLGGEIAWQNVGGPIEYHSDEGVSISFPLFHRVSKRRAEETVSKNLKQSNITWLARVNKDWQLNLDEMREFVESWRDVGWMTGTILVQPEVELEQKKDFNEIREETFVRFIITLEDIVSAAKKRIFLSHKGVDKPLVRRIHSALSQLGFDPWLDEADMNAGAELERALLQGMKDSCAAVFFATPDYVDDNYLATEVDYAVDQKRSKKDDFSIVTLVLQKENEKGAVPDLLRRYVWKEPSSELEMLTDILKALPICVGVVRWRKEVT